MPEPPVVLPLGGEFALDRIQQISVNAHDLERAVRFYREVLRLRFLFQAEKLAFFDAGGIRLMLSVAERPEFDHPGSVLYFWVPQIRAGYQALVERGVRFEGPPQMIARLERAEVWMAFFRDPEGNLLALTSEEPRAAA
ncbi:MAG TPA: VOC family protein [Terriglobales bacterium]|nr:VOC family protein [Terriglobales bacterium]